MIRRGDKGFVLVSVLWVTAILTVLAIGFGRRAMLDRRAATISVDYAVVRAEARGQVHEGAADIVNAMALFSALTRGNPLIPIPQFQYRKPPEPKVIVEKGDHRIEDTAYYVVEDEERKIAINSAPEEMLEMVPGLTFSMVNEIIRRRGGETSDDEVTPFQSIEEIREVAGYSDDEWYGDGATTGVRDLITLWGDGKINVNTASEDVLRMIPQLDDEVIASIIGFRRGPDGDVGTDDDRQFGGVVDVANALKLSAERTEPLRRYAKTESNYFRVTGVATLRGGRVRAATTAVIAINRGEAEVLRWSEETPRG